MDLRQPFSSQSDSSTPLSLGASVKERMAMFQKQGKQEPQQARPGPIDSGVSVRDRARTINVVASAAPAPVRKDPIVISTSAPWQASAIASPKAAPNIFTIASDATAPQGTETESVPRISVKDRVNQISAIVKQQTSPSGPKPPIEISGTISEKKAMLGKTGTTPKNSSAADMNFHVAQRRENMIKKADNEEAKKEEVLRTGKVAELAGRIQTSISSTPAPQRTIDIGVSIQQKKQMLSQNTKFESADRAKADLAGLPSLEARKSLITTPKSAVGETRKEPIFELGEEMAERKARIKEMMEARNGLGPMATIPIGVEIPATFAGEGISAQSSTAQCEVEKPTKARTVMRKAANFDEFD